MWTAKFLEPWSSSRFVIPPTPADASLLLLSWLVGADGAKWEDISRVQHADITSCIPGSDIRALLGDIRDTGIWETFARDAWGVISVCC